MLMRPGLLSPFVQRRRIAAAAAFSRGRVLDIGCGDGSAAPRLAAPADYLGVDIEPSTLAIARRNQPRYRFVDRIPTDEAFDTAVALAVIEHVDDPAAAVAEWIRPLRAGGRLVLTTPHRSFRFVHEATARVGLMSREAAEDHRQMFDRASLVAALAPLPLSLAVYRRFLLGMNQLFVFERR